ncbi:MAG: serine hydrolase domain-containing protein [Bacteroidia bacterium]|nr:serine hydrolase domain-containing protein [Bacteroidia bacterium]
MRHLLILNLIFFVFPSFAFAQNQDLQLDRYLQSIYKEAAAPGFSVSIVEKGEVRYQAAFGKEILGQKAPMRVESVLPIGSLTKSMTALALMQLVEKGQLDLDKPIVEYVPEFQTAKPEKSSKITCRMLLNNSSALYGGYSDGSLEGDSATYQLMKSLDGTYLEQEPGLFYRYSNTAFSLAGYLLHAISGEAYADYLERHIFKPLGMNSTSTRFTDFEQLESIDGHYYGINSSIPAHIERNQEAEAMIPAGSLMRSSAKDLSAYMLALLNPNTSGIISIAGREKLWEAQSCFAGFSYEEGGEDEEFGYGLGWMRGNIEGKDLVFHGGSTGTASSIMILDPLHEIGVVVLLNLDYTFIDRYRYRTEFNIAYNLLRIVLGQSPNEYGQPRITDPSLNEYDLDGGNYEHYIGSYQFAGGGDNFVYHGVGLQIKPEEKYGLVGEAYRGSQLLSRFQLDFVNKTLAMRRFQGQADPLRFSLDRKGQVKGVEVFGSRFIRRDSNYFQRFQELNTKEWKCLLPMAYQMEKNGEMYLLRKAETCEILLGFDNLSPEARLSNYFPDQAFERQGIIQQQKIGTTRWEQHAFLGSKRQVILLRSQLKGRHFQIVMSTPIGELSQLASSDLYGIISSFSRK